MDTDDVRKKLFDDLKAELFKRQLSNAENFDKSILTYSTAGLGLSLGFLKDFLPITEAEYGWLLYGSWGLFTAAIIITIFSYVASQRGIARQLEISELYYLKNDETAFTARNAFASLTDWLNNVSGLFFVVAIVFTTAFVSINLERASIMAEEKKVFQKTIGTGDVQKGAPIPPLQQIPQQQVQQEQPQRPAQTDNSKGGDKK